jgi:hypothetical protein
MSPIAFTTGRRWGAALALLVVPACSSSGPTNSPLVCTLIACENGLNVDLEPGSNWPAGTYTFAIEADDARVTCRGSLPLPPCSAGSAVTCDTPALVSIAESGCALPASAHGFSQIRFESRLRPKRVVVGIARNDSVVARAELAPEFLRAEPNGPGCPPICTQARARVAVGF